MLCFNKGVGVYRKEEQADVEYYPYEEEMEDVKLDDERENHWRMVFEDNDGEEDDKKALLNGKSWGVYVN